MQIVHSLQDGDLHFKNNCTSYNFLKQNLGLDSHIVRKLSYHRQIGQCLCGYFIHAGWLDGWMDQGDHSWYQTILLLKVRVN